ncbi:MAG TPA: hypothetical protein DCP90_09330 [Clostridiales bacterium]|nr:MAG: hypothetical protein A2Y22_04720 [Clostridiales bacterium GWD2_32_59]HAN10795.1 hypothetical protein [Clostridiales bacterium]
MDIKEFYIKNKYSINGAISVVIFIIALIPMYLLYNYYSNYGDAIDKEKSRLKTEGINIEQKIKRNEENIELKKQEIKEAENYSQTMAEDLDKYPQDDRKTAVFGTKLYLLAITQNVEVTALDVNEEGIVPGEIEQIPITLKCRSDYPSMMVILNKIYQRKFLYIKDIEIKLDGITLGYSLEMVTLAKKMNIQDVPTNTEIQPETPEIKIVMRSDNPFGNTSSSVEQPIPGNDVVITTPEAPSNNVAPPNNNDIPSNNNYHQVEVERLYPLDVDAELIQDYNEKKNIINDNISSFSHSISLKASVGTEVKAVKDGKVIFVGKFGTHGNSIMIEHREGNISYYGNLGNVTVYKGQSIKKGKTIGYTGGTGDLSVSHLKFGYTIDGKFVDPQQFMNMTTE